MGKETTARNEHRLFANLRANSGYESIFRRAKRYVRDQLRQIKANKRRTRRRLRWLARTRGTR